MTDLALAGAVAAYAIALLVVLLVIFPLRSLWDSRVVRRFPEVSIDPYYVIAVANPAWDRPLYAAVASALLVDGLISIDAEGLVTVTERGSDPANKPAHPLEAAVLEWLAAAGEPVALSQIRSAHDMDRQREEFVREQVARLPRWARRKADLLRLISMVTVVSLTVFWGLQLTYFGALHPTRVWEGFVLFIPFLVIWLLFLVPLGWILYKLWPKRRYRFQEYCAKQPPPPAVTRLSATQTSALASSWAYQTEAEKQQAAEQQRMAYWETGSDTI
ncbi:hypothetical protein AB0F72_37585 [Actinoplanes sp. NPDC023936]|uniref:hypothetical protein n=1 Tax=Actinoplanes sp. NPDC023936 TaxID=3154910 RepID=UPI003410F5D3